MCPKDADRIANSAEPDKTARSSLIRVYTVCPDLLVCKLRITTVFSKLSFGKVNRKNAI